MVGVGEGGGQSAGAGGNPPRQTFDEWQGLGAMELPYFKAFPTDWEITMRKAGIPPAKRGTVYRLIFFAWQEQGLNLTEDETYERRMRVLAQAFGMSYCRFKPYLAYYKSLSECQNGLWLPSFLLQQLQHAMRFQSGFGSRSEQSQSNVETDSEQSQNKVRTKSEQSQNNISGLNPLPAIPLKHEQEHDQEQRESARAREDAPPSPVTEDDHTQAAPLPSPVLAPSLGETPFDSTDDSAPLDPEYTIGERFVLKACGLWDTCRAEADWRLRDAVRRAGAFVSGRIVPEQNVGGTPALWSEFWFEKLGRKGNPRPEWVVEQWSAYDRWLIENHETHRLFAREASR